MKELKFILKKECWNTKLNIVLCIVFVSLLFNVIAVLPYVKPYYNKIERKYFPPEHFSIHTPDKYILDKVCEATLQLKGVKMLKNEFKGLPQDIKALFTPPSKTTKNDFITSYALVGISYYALLQNDNRTMKKLQMRADDFINMKHKTLNYKIEKIDQASIGILLLNLYKWSEESVYLETARNLVNTIKKMRGKDGVIMYVPNLNYNFVDAVGMYVPFLMEYFKVTGDSIAYQIADYNMKVYYANGVNKDTGIPAHGYHIKSGLHIGSANWGRGIGWYLLAAAFCPEINDPKLNASLAHINYTQFPGNSDKFDSSTALMFEIYKQSKDRNRRLSLNFIKPHILTNGFVDDCSGDTYDLNNYSQSFGESELCNGLLMILVSKFNNK